MRALLSLLTLASLLFAPRWTRAEPIGVLGLRMIDAPPALRELADHHLRQALSRGGDRVVAPTASKQSATCALGPCLDRLGRRLGAELLVTGAVAAHGTSSFDILLTMTETAGGTVLAQISRRCDVCTYADAGEAVAKAASALRRAGRRRLAARAWLELRSQPPGATVALDGTPLGPAPQRRLVGPGPHRLSTRTRQGEAIGARTITLRAGERRTITLRPGVIQPATSGADRPRARAFGGWRWLGWSALGAGVAAGTTGAILLSTEERTAGATLLGAGGAALASGVLVLLLDRIAGHARHRSDRHRSDRHRSDRHRSDRHRSAAAAIAPVLGGGATVSVSLAY